MKTQTDYALRKLALAALGLWLLAIGQPAHATSLDLNFNSEIDSNGNSQGNLVFNGPNGFQVVFTDDGSNGVWGGKANGVHITNLGAGNIKVGTTDLVLGAFNNFVGVNNYHSSGIVAMFNQGVDQVSFFDTDDDSTTKALFAFDQLGNLIGQTSAGSQIPFAISTANTGGVLIYKVEFDTAAGTAGGSNDSTYFTIDNFHVEYTPSTSPVPEPAIMLLFGTGIAGLAGTRLRSRRSRRLG